MGLIILIAGLFGLVAQVPPASPEAESRQASSAPDAPATAEAPDEPPEPETVRMLAIHATQEEGHTLEMDLTLAPLEEYLTELPFNTFHEAEFTETEVEYGEETHFTIGAQYSLDLTLKEVTELGQILFDAHLNMIENGQAVEALRVSGRAVRGQGVFFRGLPMASGELVVVVSVAQAPPPGGGNGRGGEQNESSSGGGNAAQQQTGAGGGPAGGEESETEPGEINPLVDDPLAPARQEDVDDREEPEEPMPAVRVEPNETLPPDLANLEGILRVLEEQDEREQAQARNRRFEVIIRGDWW